MKLCNRECTPNTGTGYNHLTKWPKFLYRSRISLEIQSRNVKKKCTQLLKYYNSLRKIKTPKTIYKKRATRSL